VTQGPIENPVINSPFVEPVQHFVTTAHGTVTGEIEPRRRPSEFFVPVARPKKMSGQLTLDAFGGPKRHAYFTGADDPYDKLRRALRADISDEAWATVNSNVSRPSRARRPARSP
jgi:hypothetical protein